MKSSKPDKQLDNGNAVYRALDKSKGGKSDQEEQEVNIGIAWYLPEQWPLLRATASDSHSLEKTYNEWLEYANDVINKLKEEGYNPVKVNIDIERFNAWCRKKKKAPDGNSRSEYVSQLLKSGLFKQ